MPTSRGTLSSKVTRHKNLISILICLSLAILTVITFWSLKNCGFINFDDNIYVYKNAYVQSGLNANSIGHAFSFSSELLNVGHWHPLTWLSLMLDYQIFGLNPQGFHLINLLFHVMNTILLFLILRRMTKKLWPSAFVAAVFAIHPVHVESVAWISERKDVLSTFFWMLTLGAYSYYVEHPGFRRYCFVFLFFALGLTAKSMLVTLPFVLLLMDYWPLRRFQKITGIKPSAARDNSTNVSNFIPTCRDSFSASLISIGVSTIKSADHEHKWSLIFSLLQEKVPLFILAILSSIVALVAPQTGGAVSSVTLPLVVRIGNAFISYVVYIGKTIWPINLAVFYPHPGVFVPWQVFGSVFLLIAITLVVIWRVKRSPYLATGWLWYIGTLVPVIGIFQAGAQAMADRYTYIPLIGLFIMAAWGLPELFKKWTYRKEILLASSALSILGLSIITCTQVGYWKDSIELWNHTLQVTDDNWLAYNNRGSVFQGLGNYRQAIEDFNNAIKSKADYNDAYNNRGVIYEKLGNHRQAIEDYNRAIEIRPDYAIAYSNRGVAYASLGDYGQAMDDYERAIEINPGYAEAYINRGSVYQGLGDYRQALEDYGRAIKIKPGDAKAYISRGLAYAHLGNYGQAIDDFNKAIEIEPSYATAYFNRGVAYIKLGNNNLAVNDLQTAAKLGHEKAKNFLISQGISW